MPENHEKNEILDILENFGKKNQKKNQKTIKKQKQKQKKKISPPLVHRLRDSQSFKSTKKQKKVK